MFFSSKRWQSFPCLINHLFICSNRGYLEKLKWTITSIRKSLHKDYPMSSTSDSKTNQMKSSFWLKIIQNGFNTSKLSDLVKRKCVITCNYMRLCTQGNLFNANWFSLQNLQVYLVVILLSILSPYWFSLAELHYSSKLLFDPEYLLEKQTDYTSLVTPLHVHSVSWKTFQQKLEVEERAANHMKLQETDHYVN